MTIMDGLVDKTYGSDKQDHLRAALVQVINGVSYLI